MGGLSLARPLLRVIGSRSSYSFNVGAIDRGGRRMT